MVMVSTVVEDLVDFEFFRVIDGNRVRRKRQCRAMFDRVRVLVWTEDGYMEDWVYLEGVREIEFVCDVPV